MPVRPETELVKQMLTNTTLGHEIKKIAQLGWDTEAHTDDENGVAFRLGLPNLLDTDDECRDTLCDMIQVGCFPAIRSVVRIAIHYDLVSFGIHCADWTGIVNEIRGSGRTCAEFMGDINPTDYQQQRPTSIVIDELWNNQAALTYVRGEMAKQNAPAFMKEYAHSLIERRPWPLGVAGMLSLMLSRVDWERVARALQPEE